MYVQCRWSANTQQIKLVCHNAQWTLQVITLILDPRTTYAQEPKAETVWKPAHLTWRICWAHTCTFPKHHYKIRSIKEWEEQKTQIWNYKMWGRASLQQKRNISPASIRNTVMKNNGHTNGWGTFCSNFPSLQKSFNIFKLVTKVTTIKQEQKISMRRCLLTWCYTDIMSY